MPYTVACILNRAVLIEALCEDLPVLPGINVIR